MKLTQSNRTGGKLTITDKIQYYITCAAVIFIALTSIISIVGLNGFSDIRSEKIQGVLSGSTSAPPLTRAQRRDRTWTDDKCKAEFPLLYPQLEESMKFWKEKGGIKKEMLDRNERECNKWWGYTRLVIRNGNLYIRNFHEGIETRNSAMVHMIAMALASWPTSSKKGGRSRVDDELPPIELILTPGDKDTGFSEGGWAVTKPSDGREPGTWLLPDFGFISWPEAGAGYYEDFLDLSLPVEEEYPWDKKMDKVFWRGWPNQYPVRIDLMNRVNTIEDPSREEWADVRRTSFHNDVDIVPLVSLPDHCKHKFLIHTEGNSYSGRSKYLLSCRSTTIIHPMEWTQHFHPALNGNPGSPNQNYVQLQGPHFADLEETAIELRKADAHKYTSKVRNYIGTKTTEKIAENAARTLRDRYLSSAATMCYVRAALRHYASVVDASSFGPQGVQLIPGEGVGPGASKGKPMDTLKGDIEVGVWRLLGGPNWPPTS